MKNKKNPDKIFVKILVCVFSALILITLAGCNSSMSSADELDVVDDLQSLAGFRAAPLDLEAPFLREPMVEEGVYRFGKGDMFFNAMKILKAPSTAAREVVYSYGNKCGLNMISSGDEMPYTIVEGKGLDSFSFPCGDYEVMRVKFEEDRSIVQIEEIPHEEKEKVYVCKVEKNSSMIGSAVKVGIPEGKVMALAKIFRSDVDFNNDIHAGDQLRVWMRETQDKRGNALGRGRVIAALFILGSKEYWGIKYEEENDAAFYDLKGRSLKKSFLKSPLPFLRVTSGFTLRRFHPVLGVVRPHLGVDFGAPTGTPIMAAAKGKIIYAGWMKGYGYTVKIRHTPKLMTLYGHMSKILVKRGQEVKQGKVIGHVGATGLATGPHLHYGMYKNGKAVDPMSVKMEATSIVDSDEFKARRDRAVKLLSKPVPGNVVD